MRKISVVSILVSLLFILPASAESARDQGSRVITVGMFPDDYPPLFWHSGQKGIIQKLLENIEARSNFVFETRLYPFNRLINNVASGNLDLEAWTAAAWRQDVAADVYFTEPFAEHCEILVFRASNSNRPETLDGLKGKRIGVVQDYTFNSFTTAFEQQTIIRVDSSNEERVLNMLIHERSDVALIDELVARHLMKTAYPDTFSTGARFDCTPISFMFSNNKKSEGKEISDLLQILKKEGVRESILREYQ